MLLKGNIDKLEKSSDPQRGEARKYSGYAFIVSPLRQLIAADQSGTFKAMQEVKHNKAEAGIKAIKAHLQNNGYKVLRPVKADRYSGGDFLLPLPGKEYLQKRCYY